MSEHRLSPGAVVGGNGGDAATAPPPSWSDIDAGFDPLFRSRHELPVSRPDVYRLLVRLHMKRLRSILRSRTRVSPRYRSVVADIYSREYRLSTAEFVRERAARRDVFLTHGRPLCVDGWFTFEYRADVLERALRAAGAGSALEVGSGRGLLLALLALRLPELDLEGIDLADAGVVRGRELAAEPPPELLRLAGLDALTDAQNAALARLRFHQGDAAEMPFADKSFDVSFTCLSLEQMPRSVSDVLQEMNRVTREYCVFLEPFAEANGPLGLAQLRVLDYFHGKYERIRDHGLEPVYFTRSIPQKVRFKTGLLVARVVREAPAS
jgi:SAM-dependent methyltransferase